MEDTAISYDLVHHPQQPQHHHHQQQQQQTWNHGQGPPHQYPADANNVYTNQTNTLQQANQNSQAHPRPGLQGGHLTPSQHSPAPQGNMVDQYHQHHGSVNSNAPYYQHMPYHQAPAHPHQPDQQQQQQPQPPPPQHHTTPDHLHAQYHHPQAAPVPTNVTPGVNQGAVAQQQHGITPHHPQNAQASTLNQTSWSPGFGTMVPQAHHPIVNDQSTYMTHGYQNHNNPVGDPHCNSNESIPNHAPPQGSPYTVDPMYNTPAPAAYDYNNYDAPFFQSSNNGPHQQTGQPPPANVSTYWIHNQANQARPPHPQGYNNQVTAQQPIAPDQANFMHDPNMYYGRPAYGQGMQNFNQGMHYPPPQSDVAHHRMASMPPQHPMQPQQQQHELQLPQVAQQQSYYPSPLNNQNICPPGHQNLSNSQHPPVQHPSNNQSIIAPSQVPINRQNAARPSPQAQVPDGRRRQNKHSTDSYGDYTGVPTQPAQPRRKRPYMTEEHKQSGYAKFYQIKRKELKSVKFGQASTMISDLWNKLSVEEKSVYVKDVSIKRKRLLKKKAMQQAQDLLIQGIKEE